MRIFSQILHHPNTVCLFVMCLDKSNISCDGPFFAKNWGKKEVIAYKAFLQTSLYLLVHISLASQVRCLQSTVFVGFFVCKHELSFETNLNLCMKTEPVTDAMVPVQCTYMTGFLFTYIWPKNLSNIPVQTRTVHHICSNYDEPGFHAKIQIIFGNLLLKALILRYWPFQQKSILWAFDKVTMEGLLSVPPPHPIR